jgi:hypothetical protein
MTGRAMAAFTIALLLVPSALSVLMTAIPPPWSPAIPATTNDIGSDSSPQAGCMDGTGKLVTDEQLRAANEGAGGRATYPLKHNWSIIASFEWDATQDEYQDLEGALRRLARMVFDLTDGQFCIGQFSIQKNMGKWVDCDIRVLNTTPYRPNAAIGGLMWGGYIYIGRDAWGSPWNSTTGELVLAHEFMHYGLGLPDEYDDQTGSHCDNATANSCIMSSTYSYFELCTDESHNALATQDNWSCWDYIVYFYPDVVEVHGIPDPGPESCPPVTVVWCYPDLYVTSEEMAVTLPTGSEGDDITIRVAVHNFGKYLPGSTVVSFYCDTVSPENLISNATVSLGGQESVAAKIDTKAPGGGHDIIAVVDPENRVSESNETNNRASIRINFNSRPRISSSLSMLTTKEDVPLAVDLTAYANDTEDPPANLTWFVMHYDIAAISTIEHRSGTLATLVITPAPNWYGVTAFMLAVRDSNNCTATKQVMLNVTAVNDAPAALEPAATPNSTYRGGTVELTARAIDPEEPTSKLVPVFEWRPAGTTEWLPVEGYYTGTVFLATLKVPYTVPAGNASVRVAFMDTTGLKGDYIVIETGLMVLNSMPSVTGLSFPDPAVARGETVSLALQGEDLETPVRDLVGAIQYRLAGGDWVDFPTSDGVCLSGAWKYPFKVDASLAPGSYDFRATLTDSDNGTSEWAEYPNLLEVQNSIPRIESAKLSATSLVRGGNTTVSVYVRDTESSAASLSVELRCFDIKGKERKSFTAAAEWRTNHWEIRLIPLADATAGKYSISVLVTDADGGVSAPNVELPSIDVLNSPPKAAFAVTASAYAGDPVRLDAFGCSDFEQGLMELTIKWTVEGDPKVYAGPIVYVTMDKAGAHRINLTVTDKDGASASAERSVTVAAKPWQAGGSSMNILLIGAGLALIVIAVAVSFLVISRHKRAAEARRRAIHRKKKGHVRATKGPLPPLPPSDK